MKDTKYFNELVKLTNTAEKIKELISGYQKKTYVLSKMKDALGQEAYERYEPFISISIDGLINLSKKKLKIFPRKYKLCLNCISNNNID